MESSVDLESALVVLPVLRKKQWSVLMRPVQLGLGQQQGHRLCQPVRHAPPSGHQEFQLFQCRLHERWFHVVLGFDVFSCVLEIGLQSTRIYMYKEEVSER